jgi:hypothetical protein
LRMCKAGRSIGHSRSSSKSDERTTLQMLLWQQRCWNENVWRALTIPPTQGIFKFRAWSSLLSDYHSDSDFGRVYIQSASRIWIWNHSTKNSDSDSDSKICI